MLSFTRTLLFTRLLGVFFLGCALTAAQFLIISGAARTTHFAASARFFDQVGNFLAQIVEFFPLLFRRYYPENLSNSTTWFATLACLQGFVVGALIDLALFAFRALRRVFAPKA
jgi:hypothetical protein